MIKVLIIILVAVVIVVALLVYRFYTGFQKANDKAVYH